MLPSEDVVLDAEEDGDDFVFESMDGEALAAALVCGACVLVPRGFVSALPLTAAVLLSCAGDEDVPLLVKLVDVCEHIQESILSDLPEQEWVANDAVLVFVQLGKLLESNRYGRPVESPVLWNVHA